jgi:FAD/FMN-containing dehydrogenase
LLVEFDNGNDRLQTKLAKKAGKIFDRHAIRWQSETDRLKQEELWKIRHSSAIVVAQSEGNKKALPVIEDGIVPVERFHDYIQNVYALFQKAGLQVAVWGHAGDANVHLQPYFDLSQVGDRQKIFKLMDDYYRMVISLGGTTSGEHNDGRLRAPYLPEVFGPDVYALFQKIKLIFDPYGTMNPGVKMNVKLDDIKPLMRSSYSLDHLYNHMPRS